MYSISGQVLDINDDPIPDVAISAGAGISVTTSASGTYTLTGLDAGTHLLTPTLTGWSFTPPTRAVSLPPDATGQNFTGAPPKLKLLFVPLRWQGTQEAFDAEVDDQTDFFLSDVPLDNCRDRVLVEILDVTTQSFDEFTCTYPNDCAVGTIETFVREELEIDPADYDIIVGLAETSPCPPIAGCSNRTDTTWAIATEDVVIAHEIGHIYGLEDEYCSNQAGSTDERCNDGDIQGDGVTTGDLNWLDASLPFDCPPDGSADSGGSVCCNFDGHDCSVVQYPGVCCQGNMNSAGGRATMSYADAPGPRGFDDHSIAHLSSVPELICDSTFDLSNLAEVTLIGVSSDSIIDLNLLVYWDDSVVEENIAITAGRPTSASVLQNKDGEYALEVKDVNGGALWNQSFSIHFDYNGPVFLGVDYSGVNYEAADVGFKIPYDVNMHTIALYHSGSLIFSRQLPTTGVYTVYLPLVLRVY